MVRLVEFESASAVGSRVEENVPMQGGADVDAARGEPLELDRGSTREDREHDVDIGPSLLTGSEPAEVGPLHLARVSDDRRPPWRCTCRRRVRDRVDEEEAGAAQQVEDRGEGVEIVETIGTYRHACKAGARPAHGERHDPTGCGRCQLEDAVLPDALELLALGLVDHIEPERRLQRDDGGVDARTVQHAEPYLELVLA